MSRPLRVTPSHRDTHVPVIPNRPKKKKKKNPPHLCDQTLGAELCQARFRYCLKGYTYTHAQQKSDPRHGSFKSWITRRRAQKRAREREREKREKAPLTSTAPLWTPSRLANREFTLVYLYFVQERRPDLRNEAYYRKYILTHDAPGRNPVVMSSEIGR